MRVQIVNENKESVVIHTTKKKGIKCDKDLNDRPDGRKGALHLRIVDMLGHSIHRRPCDRRRLVPAVPGIFIVVKIVFGLTSVLSAGLWRHVQELRHSTGEDLEVSAYLPLPWLPDLRNHGLSRYF